MQGRILKPKNVTSFSVRGKHDFVCAAADKRMAMSAAAKKQALVHIYNIVVGAAASNFR
jgi:hypothetical protein